MPQRPPKGRVGFYWLNMLVPESSSLEFYECKRQSLKFSGLFPHLLMFSHKMVLSLLGMEKNRLFNKFFAVMKLQSALNVSSTAPRELFTSPNDHQRILASGSNYL